MPRCAVVLAIVLAACGFDSTTAGSPDTSAGATEASSPPPADPSTTVRVVSPMPDAEYRVPEAITLSVVSGHEAGAVVAWKTSSAVHVAFADPSEVAMTPSFPVHLDAIPFPHPIERPALMVDEAGVIHIAFTASAPGGGSVEYRSAFGGEVEQTGVVSGEPRPETNLVHMTPGRSGPILAWLEESTLSVALPEDGGFVEREMVDPLTCDCCDPAPVLLGELLVVAYRDLIRDGSDVIRDVNVVASSDGGETFGEPLVISDDNWFIDACPFTGPTAGEVDGVLVVAWMDARQSVFPDQRASSIWVDRSTDGGRTFGTDVRLGLSGINRSPRMTVDSEGVIHLVWEVQGADGGIAYARSSDAGESFSDQIWLVRADNESGPVRVPSVGVHEAWLMLSWLDREGGHVAAFDLEDLRE